jgi:hypothetical protein
MDNKKYAEHHQKLLSGSLEALEMWRSEKNECELSWILGQVLGDLIKGAVRLYPEEKSGISYIIESSGIEYLKELDELNTKLYEEFLNDKKPPKFSADLDLVHLAMALNKKEIAKRLVVQLIDEKALKYKTWPKFWKEFCKSTSSYLFNHGYEPDLPKLTGYDKHWATYIYLMNSIESRKEIESSIKLVNESFSARNKDKRLSSSLIDGDGHAKANWNFRKHAILQLSNS